MKLRLLTIGDREIICDDDGRPLDGVIGFDYSSPNYDGEATVLTIRLSIPPPRWDEELGRKLFNPVATTERETG